MKCTGAMALSKKDIIHQLQKEILPLQGFRPPPPGAVADMGLGPIAAAFPNAVFPTGAIHEFISTDAEHVAATGGFISGLLAGLMRGGRVVVWISSCRMLFPPALKMFGLAPDNIIF